MVESRHDPFSNLLEVLGINPDDPPLPHWPVKTRTPANLAEWCHAVIERVYAVCRRNQVTQVQRAIPMDKCRIDFDEIVTEAFQRAYKIEEDGHTLLDPPAELRGTRYNVESTLEVLEQLKVSAGGANGKKSPGLGKEKLDKPLYAMAALVAHPDWTVKQIAESIGLSRTSLYRYPEFIAARTRLRSMSKGSRNDLPRGRKSYDGTIEAWDE